MFPATTLGTTGGSAADAAAALAAAKLTDTCDIWRLTRLVTSTPFKNAEGGLSEKFPDAWTRIGTSVPCLLLDPTSQAMRESAGADVATARWQLEVPLATDIRRRDVVTKGGRRFDVDDHNRETSGQTVLTARLTTRD